MSPNKTTASDNEKAALLNKNDVKSYIDVEEQQQQQKTIDLDTCNPQKRLLSTRSLSFQERPAFSEHLGQNRQYWRDIMLGVNDGLASTFLLVTGVSGANMSTSNILLTAVSGALAGAISMAAGEFIATKSQDEILQGEIELEHAHIRNHRVDEMKELDDLLSKIGILSKEEGGGEEESELRNKLLSFYDNNDEALLKIMIALEFGVLEEERRYPFWAAAISFATFLLGALPSVVPFAIVTSTNSGLLISGVGTGLGLMLVGAAKTFATRGKWLQAALENLAIAGVGAIVAYCIGCLFDRMILS